MAMSTEEANCDLEYFHPAKLLFMYKGNKENMLKHNRAQGIKHTYTFWKKTFENTDSEARWSGFKSWV